MAELVLARRSCSLYSRCASAPARVGAHGFRHEPKRAKYRANAVFQDIPVIAELSGHPGLLSAAICNSAVFAVGFKVLRKGLTPAGIAHAWCLGTSVFAAFGIGGYFLVCIYFIFGTLVTKLKLEQKQREGIAEARSGQRGPGSVWGSGIAGTACAVLALISGSYDPWQIGFVASFCSKLSDTVSSEVGKAYGKTTYLVTTFQRVPRGTEGAVSLEGTAAGAGAAVAFAVTALLVGQVPDATSAGIVAAAATLANLAESYLGATLQGRVTWLNNDLVNMLQITLAASIAVGARLAVHAA